MGSVARGSALMPWKMEEVIRKQSCSAEYRLYTGFQAQYCHVPHKAMHKLSSPIWHGLAVVYREGNVTLPVYSKVRLPKTEWPLVLRCVTD